MKFLKNTSSDSPLTHLSFFLTKSDPRARFETLSNLKNEAPVQAGAHFSFKQTSPYQAPKNPITALPAALFASHFGHYFAFARLLKTTSKSVPKYIQKGPQKGFPNLREFVGIGLHVTSKSTFGPFTISPLPFSCQKRHVPLICIILMCNFDPVDNRMC